MLRYQERQFQRLLQYVWNRSAFYREYYASQGVRENDLADISISDLPLLPKKTLIDNFDRAVTDPRLTRRELGAWFESHRDPGETFCKDMVVIHSSGTSGDIGIFAYDRTAWTIADATVAGRLPSPENYPNGKTKVAFYIVGDSHSASLSMAKTMPRDVYDTLILSLLNSSEQTVRQLSEFQPHRLSGYSSAVAQLAELALKGRLQIHPQKVFVYGDKLTQSMEKKIREAWGVPIYVLYAASESKFIAIKTPEHEQMMVMDDLNIVEVLDKKDQAVSAGKEGRVVLTNLYNYTLPILRYELGDYVVKGTELHDGPFSTLRDIRGRVNDALPIVLSNGLHDSIHPLVLTTLFVPTIEKYQFVSASPEHVRIDYVAPRNIDAAVREEIQKMLDAKGAAGTTVDVRNVPAIDNDPKTGKLRLVKFEAQQAKRPHSVIDRDVSEIVPQRVDIKPAPSFVPFARADIEQSIPARFEQQVEKYADRLALKSGDLSLSYGELNRAANRLARAIIDRLGSKPEPVALLLRQGIPAVLSILGILKAGKCYVALDPTYPEARLGSILEESQASLIVTDDADLSSTMAFVREPGKILNIDQLDDGIPTDNPSPTTSPDSLAYLFYTSGSTGRPKGVVQNHRNVLHQIMTYTNGLQLARDDRVTQLHSHGFSASRLDIFGALLNGAGLLPFLVAEEGMGRFARWLRAEEITLLHWVPTAFRHFADSLDKGDLFPKLRLIVLGSEPLSSRDVEMYKQHFAPSCVLVNRFGTTETGNISWYFMDKQSPVLSGQVPVGCSVEDTAVVLLNDTGKRLENDQIGEIAVKSRYLSPGYWRRPDLTSASFSSDPADPETKIYRTGDMGRILPDGCLLHLGRKDFQVKIRGYRVEVGEVERMLLEHSAIAATVVAARSDHLEGKRLVAYYVCADTPPPTSSTLRNFLAARLPTYMVPSAFVRLEALPRTPSGKVDRRALPEPGSEAPDADVPIAPGRTPVEKELVQIWNSVLGIDTVGIDQNFLDLGGHSLHAMSIISRTTEVFKVEISLREFFELPTVAHMAEMIGRQELTRCDDAKVVDTLAAVDSLSDEQALQLLEKETK
jgi:amino acid adenylation domain-containing protein